MATAKKKTDLFEPTPLGTHKGLPVLRQSAQLRKGNKVVSEVMGVAPFEVEPAGDVYMAVLLHNVGENFVTVMSEDDPDLLLGWERVVVFDVLGAVPDDRPETEKDIAAMRARVADE